MLIRLFFACILVFTDLEVLSMLHEVSFHSFNGRDEVQGWVYVPACKPKGIVQVIRRTFSPLFPYDRKIYGCRVYRCCR